MTYKYQLEKGSKKHICPECGKARFVRYIDTDTGSYLNERYGRCDRENACGHHKRPNSPISARRKASARVSTASTVFIPNDEISHVLGHYDKNVFVQNLLRSERYSRSDIYRAF